MIKTILFFVFIFLFSQGCSIFEEASIHTSQQEISKQIGRFSQSQRTQCIDHIIKHGMLDTAFSILQNTTIKSQKIRQTFDIQLNRLHSLGQSLISGSSTIEPILKWGQNREQVLITFKLSHRWDTPTCNQAFEQQSLIKEGRILVYSCRCVVSRHNLNFKLELQFKQKVKQQSLILKKDGVGTYIVSITKLQEGIWKSLTANGQRRPIWNDAMVKYPNEMNEYFKLIDQETIASEDLVIQSTNQL